MTTLVAPALRPRSVVPGRQRWDADLLIGRPDLSERIEVLLVEENGVLCVRANPVTGRLVIRHDASLSTDDIGRLLRGTLTRALGVVSQPCGARRRPAFSGTWMAGTVAATAVVLRRHHRSPLTRFGVLAVAALVVVRREWRRSGNRRNTADLGREPVRRPLRAIVGPRRRRQFRTAVLLSVAVQLLDMVPTMLLSWMAVVLAAGGSSLLARIGWLGAANQLWFLAATTAVAFVAATALARVSTMAWRNLAQSVRHDWVTSTYAHVQRVSPRHLEERRITRVARVLTDDIDQLSGFLTSSADYFVQLAVRLSVLVVLFLVFAPQLAWLAFLPVPVIAYLSFRHHERSIPEQRLHGEHASQLSSRLINTLEASATVRSFGAEEYESERLRQLSEAYRVISRRLDARGVTYTQAVRVCTMASVLGVVLVGSLQVLSGRLSIAVFTTLANLPQRTIAQLPALGGAVDQYQRAVAALERVLELHALPVLRDEVGRTLPTVDGEITVDGVTFAYPGRPPVFQNLSMRFAAGRTVGIVGPSGAGKTTIATLLLRFHEPEHGRVLLDGVDLHEIRLRDVRRAIGSVSQEPFLFDGTIAENIRYGNFDATDEQVVRAARLAGAADFIELLPGRYETVVGERGVSLSGGQRQRISLARVILKNPPIAILDEATSAVDNETEALIQRALRDFSRDRTVVVIAHRLSTIRHADWIYVLGGDGTVVEAGTHAQLLARGGSYRSLWRLQVGER